MRVSDSSGRADFRHVWVVAEVLSGRIQPVTHELIGAARALADARGGEVWTVVLGAGVMAQASTLFGYGCDTALVVDDPQLAHFVDESEAQALVRLIVKYRPEIVICGATMRGRALIPRVAVMSDCGLTADCTGLAIDPANGDLLQTRPAFGGNIMATIRCSNHRPQMATVRPRVMKAPEPDLRRTGRVIAEPLPASEVSPLKRVIEVFHSTESAVNLADARFIVSGGRGLKGPEGFHLLRQLAVRVGGAVGASRAAVDAGWIPYAHQVGQTGQTIQAKVYLACGISGQIQHLVGMQSCDCIIAIDRNPDTPLMQMADIAVVGDLFEIIPELIRQIPAMKRYRVLAAGALLQLCLGTVYAFSFFQKPLMAAYGWSNGQTAGVFSLAILFLGLAAALGGPLLRRTGPRPLALAGSLLYAGAWLGGAWALSQRSLLLFQALFGVMGGIGLGLGYVTPVATVAKWFPRRKGFAAGFVVMGFGLGALLMSKLIAPQLWRITGGALPDVFRLTGWLLLALAVPAALLLANPPPAAAIATASAHLAAPPARHAYPSWSFAWVWLVFFCNITAGIIFIGFQSPLLQDCLAARNARLSAGELAAAGATLIGASALCNGLGRSLWGAVSDRIGGLATFRILLAAQMTVFLLLMATTSPALLFVGVCAVLLCYGGGFGSMPVLIAERYGPIALPRAYGAVLTAWGAAGVVGPQLAALLRDRHAERAALFGLAALILACGLAATCGLRRTATGQPD